MDKSQKDSWGWQVDRLWQQLFEWLEVKLKFTAPKSGIPEWVVQLIANMLWLLLAVGAAWVLYLILRNFIPSIDLRRFWVKPAQPQSAPTYSVAELLAKAQQYQAQQNYSEAGRYLYLAMLQRLNDAKIVLHQPSRTDREYAALLGQATVIQTGDLLLQTHEQLQFADRPLSAEAFDRCQEAYQQLDAHIQLHS
jgi:multidrug efflux pump subunit AcrB